MTCPTVEIMGRKVFLITGYRTAHSSMDPAGNDDLTAEHLLCGKCHASVEIEAWQKLRRSAKKNPDAVAFGYVRGRWVPAA